MRYLIDTNIFIDFIEDRPVSKDVLCVLEDRDNQIYVSSESIKEFIHLLQNEKIKLSKEKITFDIFDFIENELGFNIKYIAKEHLRTLTMLEKVENHNDPSDRLIIAQAMTEKIPLISSDRKFPKYRQQGLEFIANF